MISLDKTYKIAVFALVMALLAFSISGVPGINGINGTNGTNQSDNTKINKTGDIVSTAFNISSSMQYGSMQNNIWVNEYLLSFKSGSSFYNLSFNSTGLDLHGSGLFGCGNCYNTTLPVSINIYIDNNIIKAINNKGEVISSNIDASTVINFALTNYKNIYISDGTYIINSSLKPKQFGQEIKGSGYGTYLYSNISDIFYLNYSTGVKISNFYIEAPNNNAFVIENSSDTDISKLKIYNVTRGFLINGSTYSTTLSFLSITRYSNTGVRISMTSALLGADVYLTNLILDNSEIPTIGTGISINSLGGLFINGISIYKGNIGLRIFPGLTDTVSWGFINNLAVDTTNGNGVVLDSTGKIFSINFVNLWSATSQTGYGLYLQNINSSDISFTSSRFIGNDYGGIYIGGGNNYIFTSSTVAGNNMGNHANQAGILVDNGAGGTITNSVIKNQSSYRTTGHQDTSIYLYNSSNTTIIGSIVDDNSIITTTIKNVLIRDVRGYSTQPLRTITAGASPYTYYNNDSYEETVYLSGSYTQIDFIRNSITTSTFMQSGTNLQRTITLYINDAVKISYSSTAPTLIIQPR